MTRSEVWKTCSGSHLQELFNGNLQVVLHAILWCHPAAAKVCLSQLVHEKPRFRKCCLHQGPGGGSGFPGLPVREDLVRPVRQEAHATASVQPVHWGGSVDMTAYIYEGKEYLHMQEHLHRNAMCREKLCQLKDEFEPWKAHHSTTRQQLSKSNINTPEKNTHHLWSLARVHMKSMVNDSNICPWKLK